MQLFEWEDLPWFPTSMRGYMTDYLRVVGEQLRLFENLTPQLAEVMRRMGTHRIVDLCSGSGGTLPMLIPGLERALGERVEGVLSDLYPNIAALGAAASASEGRLSVIAEPVNAASVPADLEGVRTLFLGFHHLPDHAARAVLEDAVAQRRGIAVFEATERSALGILGPLTAPLILVPMTPTLRPVSLARVFWTYGIPAIPFFSAWDGVVSALRTRSPAELHALVASVKGGEGYTWDIGQSPIPKTPARTTWLFGWPSDR